ncbi:MAG: hypothetical protein J6Z31_08820 [Fibrobacter sp.]|nr:hypothetical protein [Fibrobacter sp.]
MKKFFLFFACVILFGCAKNNPEFIPLSLNWYHYEEDVRGIDASYTAAEVDSSMEETCLISMTRALMEDKNIQANSKSGKEFNVQYFGRIQSEKTVAEFRGVCAQPNDHTNFEKSILFFNGEKGCNFSAFCDKNGKIKDLKVF